MRVFYGDEMVMPDHNWMVEGDAIHVHFGYSLSSASDIDGDGHDDLIVGSDRHGVQVFMGSSAGPEHQAAWTLVNGQEFGNLGLHVSSAGDVNGDGYGDVVLTATVTFIPTYQDAVLVFHGSPSGLSAAPDWFVLLAEGGFMGLAQTVSAGDVNGDGYDDVIVGSPYFLPDWAEAPQGRVLVFLGGATGLSTDADWTYVGADGDYLGNSVSTAGDVNSDGYDDVIVGAYGHDSNHGKALVFLGSATGLSPTPAWTVVGNAELSYFGDVVSSAGDVNGDGYGDVLVATRYYSNPEAYEGAAFLYLGSPSGPSTSAAWIAEGNQFQAAYGSSAASAGDVNGDGYGDVIVGATGGYGPLGWVYLYLGSPSGLAANPAKISTRAPSEGFGQSVAGAGDLNADGLDDWIVGAPGLANGQVDEGAAFVYLGDLLLGSP